MRILALWLTLALVASAQTVKTSAELDSAMRSAAAGGAILLQPGTYTLKQHVGSLRALDRPLTISSVDPANPALIDCSGNCYISGARGVTLENLDIAGRMNWDGLTHPGESGDLVFRRIRFRDAGGGKEMLKLAHLRDVLITECSFVRSGAGAHDRPVDAVGVDDLIVEHSYFERCKGGCIQAKGGSRNTIVRWSLFNVGGSRAIQLGGSTCPTCWGPGKTPGPFESYDGEVHDNVIIGTQACFSLSTQTGGYVHHNTCYSPPTHTIPNADDRTFGGGQYLFLLMQEVDAAMPAGSIQWNRDGRIESNLFLYPIVTADNRAGINGTVTNWSSTKQVDFASFRFQNNAAFAVSPIINPNFGAQGIYPHRHAATNQPTTPFNWKGGLLDQVWPGIVDWGLGSMRALAPGYADIGARVSRKSPAGIPGNADTKQVLISAPPTAPAPQREYPEGTPLYGWQWPGWDGPLPEEQEAEPMSLWLLRLPDGRVKVFDSELEAVGWLDQASIEEMKPVVRR